MHKLTLQIYAGGEWQDAMGIGFEQPDLGLDGPCTYGYEQGYLVGSLDSISTRLHGAVSATLPLGWDAWRSKKAPVRISVNVTAHFANNVTGGFTRLRGV